MMRSVVAACLLLALVTPVSATEIMPSTTAPDRNENAAAATGSPRPRASCELIGA